MQPGCMYRFSLIKQREVHLYTVCALFYNYFLDNILNKKRNKQISTVSETIKL